MIYKFNNDKHQVEFLRKNFDTIELSYSIEQSKFNLPDLEYWQNLTKKNKEDIALNYERLDNDSAEVISTKIFLKEKGERLFNYVIEDSEGLFRFAVNKKRFKVKIYAVAFYKFDYPTILEKLETFVSGVFAISSNDLKVSRIDIAVDFKSDYDFFATFGYRMINSKYEIKESSFAQNFGKKRVKTSFNVSTNNLMLRCYDKVIECIDKYEEDIEKYSLALEGFGYKNLITASKEYFELLEKKNRIVRLEYQFKRELFDSYIDTLKDLTFKNVIFLVNHYATNHTGLKCRMFEGYLKYLGEYDFLTRTEKKKEVDFARANEAILPVIMKYVKAYHKNMMRELQKVIPLKEIMEVITAKLKEVKYDVALMFDMLKEENLYKLLKLSKRGANSIIKSTNIKTHDEMMSWCTPFDKISTGWQQRILT